MSHHQYRLFEYTKANELLIGDDVIKADITKRKIKALQKQKILAENWRLAIYYRDPSLVDDVLVMKLSQGGALAPNQKYAIAIAIRPQCIKGYDIPIAFFEHKEDARSFA